MSSDETTEKKLLKKNIFSKSDSKKKSSGNIYHEKRVKCMELTSLGYSQRKIAKNLGITAGCW